MVLFGELLLANIFVVMYAPVLCVNKPIQLSMKKWLRIRSILTSFFETLILYFLIEFWGINMIVAAGVSAMFMQGILLLPVFNHKEEKIYEEKK